MAPDYHETQPGEAGTKKRQAGPPGSYQPSAFSYQPDSAFDQV